MLCPKCGYITFDKLDACPKCRKDLSGIAEKIGGTVSAIDSGSFLDKALGKESKDEETLVQDVVAEDDSPSLSADDDSLVDKETDISLDELPEIDLSGLDTDEPEPEVKEELELPDDAEVSGAELELSLEEKDTLEIEVPESPAEPPPPPVTEDKDSGHTGLDLNDIDLSDLVTEENKSDLQKGGGQDLDLDLSSLEIESPKSEPDTPGSDLQDDDFDLSLDLDLGDSLPEKKTSDAAIPDLGLSLEKDE